MAIRDTLRKNAAPLLAPGETVQAIFPAQTTSQYFALLSFWIIIFRNSYRVIVATDRRILVCRSGRFRVTPVKGVLRELPRSTTIGPAHGLWYRFDSLGEKMYVNLRFFKDVEAADRSWGYPAS
ncbi:MAG TPA: hypothetical protein VGL75_16100 [Acidothermaceae bacterium]|jgi:hypothetical protein